MNIGYAGAFLGGVVALFSPCAALLLPSFFALAFGQRTSTLLGRVGIFYLGLLLTLIPLGLSAGTLGSLIGANREILALGGGLVLIAVGLITMAGISLPIPGLQLKGGSSPVAILALGAVYGLAGACTGPLLGALFTFVVVSGSSLYGAVLFALFGAGMALPLALLALFWDAGQLARRLKPKEIRIGSITISLWSMIAGALFIGLGLLFLLTDATGSLGGILDAGSQLELEAQLWRYVGSVPDFVALTLLVLLIALLIWWALTREASPALTEDE